MSNSVDGPLDGEFPVPDGVAPVVDRVREFIETEILPFERDNADYLGDPLSYLDGEGRLRPEVHELQSEIRRRAGEAGLYALHMPEDVGGGGLSQREHFYVQEEVFRYGTGHGSGLTRAMMAWTEGPAPPLLHLDEAQREEWLRPLVEGRETACICLTEPNAGSDLSGVETTARREGDEWVIDGHKRYITNAVYADTAQVLARTDEGEGVGSLALFLVDTDNPGYEVGQINRNIMMDGITADVHFEDCRVGTDQVVGEVGDGLPLALSWINWRRVCRPGMCVGLGRYLLRRMHDHALDREAFGDPIGRNQAVQWPIVDTLSELHATRKMAEATLAELDATTRLEALDQPPAATRRMSMLKYYPEDRLFDWADRAIQVLGGYGLMRAGGVERVFRVARNLRIPAGTTEIQKRTIARTLGLTGDGGGR
ncbi:acyl-CoA dehydrogenase [Halobacteriales archaeon QS_5_70_17]|nr:MAG: acyl-CoA dehydrogenase [Halobacteriales archaeon QS_5_70_17]